VDENVYDEPNLEEDMERDDRAYEEFKSDLLLVSNVWEAESFVKAYPKEAHLVDHFFTAENLEKMRVVLKLDSCKRAFKVEEAVYYIHLLDEVIEHIKG